MRPNASGLNGLSIGSLALTPSFSPEVTEYTAATSNNTNKVTATLKDDADSVYIELNGEELENGTSASWETGENTLTITVTDSDTEEETVYTVTVTKA